MQTDFCDTAYESSSGRRINIVIIWRMNLMLLHFKQFEKVKVNLTHAAAFKSGCFYCGGSCFYLNWINCIFFSTKKFCDCLFAVFIHQQNKKHIIYSDFADDDDKQKLAVAWFKIHNVRGHVKIKEKRFIPI